jgi:hypothetical protein
MLDTITTAYSSPWMSSPGVSQTAGSQAAQSGETSKDSAISSRQPASDSSEISPEARAMQDKGMAQASPAEAGGETELSDEEQQEVTELKEEDRKVRAHEQAHLAAAGNLARGGASFEYETGPDGVRYAVGGEVGIDTSPVDGDPQATIQKAQRIRQAALAPADPSAQDRAVAAEADALAIRARQELAQQDSQQGQASSTIGGNINLLA